MIPVKLGQTISFRFPAHNAAGSAEDASSGPNGTLVVNGVDDSASISIDDVGDGDYRFQGTFPNDLNVGDHCQWRVDGTVDGQTPIWFSPIYVVVDRYPWELALPGDEMDLVNAPNATAVAAIQDGLSTFDHTEDQVDVGWIESTDATDFFASMVTAIRSGLATATNVTDAAAAILSKVLRWFRLALRSDAAVATDHETELLEINADTGTGTGAYANAAAAQQAIRDRGDAAWTTGAGGGGGSATFLVLPQANIGRATHLPEQPYVGAQANLTFGLAGDVADQTYELIIESQANTADIAQISADSATFDNTANTTLVSFTVPANTHTEAVTWQYAVRQNPGTTNRVIARGQYPVKYAPKGD